MKTCHIALAAMFTAAAMVAGAVRADHSDKKLDAPGFRPESDLAAGFVRNLASAEIAVFPAIVRTMEGTSPDGTFAARAVAFLKENDLGTGHASEFECHTSNVEARVQWDLFQGGMKAIGEQLEPYDGVGDYILVTEYLLTPTRSGGMAAGGLHCYILDRSGANAFSFLLNSHHKAFVDAELKQADETAESQKRLVNECTRVVLEAFKEQVAQARDSTSE